MTYFKTQFSNAIDKERGEVASQVINKNIHPFVLRRTKEKVVAELPDKIESFRYFEMGKAESRFTIK